MEEKKDNNAIKTSEELIPPLDVYSRALCRRATPEEIAQVRCYLLAEEAEQKDQSIQGSSHVERINKAKGRSLD